MDRWFGMMMTMMMMVLGKKRFDEKMKCDCLKSNRRDFCELKIGLAQIMEIFFVLRLEPKDLEPSTLSQ